MKVFVVMKRSCVGYEYKPHDYFEKKEDAENCQEDLYKLNNKYGYKFRVDPLEIKSDYKRHNFTILEEMRNR